MKWRHSGGWAFLKFGFRCIVAMPLGLVIAVCFLSVIGIPIGLALGMAVGAWTTAPIRKHPLFNVEGDAE